MSKQVPKISVIVPIYRIEKLLPKCIESILNQNFTDFELILVNDGSTDSCLEISKQYEKIDDRILVVDKENAGLVSARKAGLEKANAEFIAFVDGDDWIETDFLISMYRLAESYSLDLVISGFIRAFEGVNQKIHPLLNNGVYSGNEYNLILNSMIKTEMFFQHGVSTYVWNKLFRKEILEKVLYDVPNQITMGEDAAITYSYMSKCSKIAITDTCHYYYRQRANSMVKLIQNTNLERIHLENLINYLYSSLSQKLEKIKLRDDLIYYLYSQALIRFGAALSFSEINIPFKGLRKHNKVVIFSSGTFGQRLVAFNNKSNFFNLISWIDLDHVESKKLGLNVESPYIKKSNDYDSLIIATTDLTKTKKILNSLHLYGYDINKYCPIILEKSFVIKYLKDLGFNLKFMND